MIAGLPIADFVSVMGIFFLGGVIKGILGFGLPLITMSLLPFVIPVEKGIVISALVQPLTNLGQLVQSGGIGRAFKDSLPIALTLPIGVLAGAWFLTSLDSKILLMILGVTVITFSLYNLLGPRVLIPEPLRLTAGSVLGFIGGVLGILTSINGPVFIIYLMGIGAERQHFRSTIALLFVVSALLISAGFWSIGLLDQDNVLLGASCLLPSFAGMWVGNRVGGRIPAEGFRKAVLIALALIGSSFFFREAI